jgi:hypothetical protein
MFTCGHCDKEKPDGEEFKMPMILKVAYFLSPFYFLFPSQQAFKSQACKDCAPKVCLIAVAWLFFWVIALMVAFCNWLKL